VPLFRFLVPHHDCGGMHRVARQVDPIFGDAGKVTGLMVLFFMSALFFGAIMVWILVTIMLAIPAVWTKVRDIYDAVYDDARLLTR